MTCSCAKPPEGRLQLSVSVQCTASSASCLADLTSCCSFRARDDHSVEHPDGLRSFSLIIKPREGSLHGWHARNARYDGAKRSRGRSWLRRGARH